MYSLSGLRRHVAKLVPEAKQFLDESRQQDASEWIVTLNEAIEKELSHGLREQFRAMFRINIRVTYECCSNGHVEQKPVEEHICLQLPVVDMDTIQPLRSLEDALSNYFRKERVVKHCLNCPAGECWKQLSLPVLPKVLIIQYMRFRLGQKLHHTIKGGSSLKVDNLDYELTGVLVHQGQSMESGHYYTITRCSRTGTCYMINNDVVPYIITPSDMSYHVSHAYMLVFSCKSDQAQVLPALQSLVQGPRGDSHVQEAAGQRGQSVQEQMEVMQGDPAIPVQEETCADTHPEAQGEEQAPTHQAIPDPSQQEPLNQEEVQFKQLKERMRSILAIPPKERTDEQKKEYRSLKRQFNKIKDKFPHLLEGTKPAMTDAERKAASRQAQSMEAQEREKAADRARLATEKNRTANRERMADQRAAMDGNTRVETRAAVRTQKAAQRGAAKVRPKDGLNNELVMQGQFPVPINSIGAMTHRCKDCGALKFEKKTGMACCLDGKVNLRRFRKPPPAFLMLWFGQDIKASVFRKYSCSFNNGLCLSSVKVNERRFSGFTPNVVFEGRVHQYVSPLQARDGEIPRFTQLYVHDPAIETTACIANMQMPANISEEQKLVVRSVVEQLQADLKQHNPFVKDFRQIIEIPEEELQPKHSNILASR